MLRMFSGAMLFAACLIAASPAVAQSGLGGIADSVSVLDRNFDAADRNGNGLLDRAEAQAGHVAFIHNNFDAIDTTGRGEVSKDDVHQYIKRMLLRGHPAPASSAG